MSESAAEGGDSGSDTGSAPLSDAQFGDFTTAQSPGDGLAAYGFYPAGFATSPRPVRTSRRHKKHKPRK